MPLCPAAKPLIETRLDDLLVFPTDEAASCGAFNTDDLAVIRRRADLPSSRANKLMARFHPLALGQLVYPNIPPRIGPLLTAKGRYLQKGADACQV